ncbi:MAG: DUF1592 domain-containing protein [Acidobacteria bacterium]|nr:DUF1592 domain-containing protein [Acidobacteriota bacterium]
MARGLSVFFAGLMTVTSVASRCLEAAGPAQQPAAAAAASASSHRAVLDQYCVTCHSERLKVGGLALDGRDLTKVTSSVDVWEKVIRKVGAGQMPPAGRPRPDKATTDGLVSWLETEIDRAAASKPEPGRTEAFHRLNRVEYQNSVRDLLGLEIDGAALLPADSRSYGFDNIAGVLSIPPTVLERYIGAAWQISRLAVGNRGLSPTAETFRLRSDLAQDDRNHELPLGTRGGTVIPYTFPLDAEYKIAVEVAETGRRDANSLEIAVDGERVHLVTVPARRPMGLDYNAEKDEGMEVRLPVKAGIHLVAVTFIRKTSALAESARQPFLRPLVETDAGDNMLAPSVASVTITGPYDVNGSGDTSSRRRIFTCRPARAAEETACATKILSKLAQRAYRRSTTDADLQQLLTFYNDGRKGEDGFEGGIEGALRALLVSPEFLFRVEVDPAGAAPNSVYRISDLELASRLSFFLWSSIPDDALLDLAIKGRLKDPAVLEQQVRRMLADPRSEALSANFAGQYLLLRNLPALMPDQWAFPNFGDNLRQDFRRETELLFDSILRENRSVLDLLKADYTFVNERLARHYGIPNVYGDHFRRVPVTDPNRRGLLGQGSFLTATSYADRTSVVLRGKWILQNLLGTPPPPPPANVPPLGEKKAGGKVSTLRERMEQHRANPVCATCHSMIDPLGFALENFDAVGQWRELETFKPINTGGALVDGTKFEGPAGLREALLSRPDQIITTLTEALFTYALGRGVEVYDAPAVRKAVHDAARTNYSFSSLILGLVKSTPFQMRKSGPSA